MASVNGPRRLPPAATPARALTFVSPFLPIVLPLAVYFHVRARAQARSNADYEWTARWFDRPVLFTVSIWAAFLALAFALFGISALLGQNFA